jgi:hypothetical protein
MKSKSSGQPEKLLVVKPEIKTEEAF